MNLTPEEKKAIIEALEYYLKRWPAEDNREAMESARRKMDYD